MTQAEGDSGSPVATPFDLLGWIEDNAQAFEPPVSNKQVWRDGDHIFMIVRGPNARSDFHIDPFDEIFMQLKGSIRVDVMIDGERHERWIHEGQVMLVPGNMAHSPLRPADTWGLVIERPREPDALDTLVWFCEVCGEEIRRASFALDDIEVQLAEALNTYNADETARTCPNGHLNPIPQPFTGTPP